MFWSKKGSNFIPQCKPICLLPACAHRMVSVWINFKTILYFLYGRIFRRLDIWYFYAITHKKNILKMAFQKRNSNSQGYCRGYIVEEAKSEMPACVDTSIEVNVKTLIKRNGE